MNTHIESTHKMDVQLMEALEWRYATKKFDTNRAISDADLRTLMQAMRLAPSSMGLQPYRFLRITDPKLRAELQKVSFNQSQITQASELIVFAAKTEYTDADIDEFLDASQKARGFSDEDIAKRAKSIRKHVDGFSKEDLPQWNAKQLYIAMGQLLTSAALMGIDACPMEGVKPEEYASILKLEGLEVCAVVCLGYRSSDDALATQAKIRLPLETLVKTY